MGHIGMCDPKGYGFSAVLVINTGLSISFEVASSFWKVDVSLLSERRRREPPRGVWGHAPPENFEI